MYTKIIAYLLSKLSLGLGVALLIPTTMSIIKDEACTFDFVLSVITAVVLSLALGIYGKDADRKDISVRE
ncbi:MAG: hypothetical protein IKV70_02150, partial [Phascolarctobacterium sp.]|nr:hypothetical protein [Phascolarctobacterium sp.]